MRLKFNACPKCSGDLEIRRDVYGMFVSCLQCGLQRDLDAPVAGVELDKRQPTAAPAPRQELLKAA